MGSRRNYHLFFAVAFLSLIASSGVKAEPHGLPPTGIFETDVMQHRLKMKGARYENGPTICYRYRMVVSSPESIRLSLRFVHNPGCETFTSPETPLFDDDMLFSSVEGSNCLSDSCSVIVVPLQSRVNKAVFDELLAKLNFASKEPLSDPFELFTLGEAEGIDGFLVYPLVARKNGRGVWVAVKAMKERRSGGFEIKYAETAVPILRVFSRWMWDMEFRFHSVHQ